jgi:hypothetical protein
MKKLNLLMLLSLFLSSQLLAQTPIFTSLSTNGKNVLAGVKLEKKDHEPETYLIKISAAEFESKKINLPLELIHREIIAIFPAENNMAVVVTQRTVEQGDRPQFHSYNLSTQTWKKLAEAECKSLTKAKIEKATIAIYCSETDVKGNDVESERKIDLKGIIMSKPQVVTLPVKKDASASLKAELIGEDFDWHELKVSVDKREKVIKP